jgi:cobalamin biosynthesis protein CobD/CbiB
MKTKQNSFQLIWGIALVLAGIGVFFRIPEILPKIRTLPVFADMIPFITFCFYLMGILLIGGGGQKIFRHFRRDDQE